MAEHHPNPTLDARGDGGSLEAARLRQALGHFATGVTVITTCTRAGKLEGLTANSFSSVSLDPPLVLWSLRRTAASLASFQDSGSFAVNVLASAQLELAQHFARPSRSKFEAVAFTRGHGGCPILDGALATFECSVETTTGGGDHVVFIGRVHHAICRDGEPLIFSAGRYCRPADLIAKD
jgi:flavin reductase (DIM6/NTAB) family NADH-FMN oxidoreductase RutF